MHVAIPMTPINPLVADGEEILPRNNTSLTSMTVHVAFSVFSATLLSRVQKGILFMAHAARARLGIETDLRSALLTAPTPPLSVTGFETAFISAQFAAALAPSPDCPFSMLKIPSICIEDYVNHRFSTVNPPPSSYFKILLLLERVIVLQPHLFLHSRNVHALFLAALVVTSLPQGDLKIAYEELAHIEVVSPVQLKNVENAFRGCLDGRIHVPEEELDQYVHHVVQEAVDTPMGIYVVRALRQERSTAWDVDVRATSTWRSLAEQHSAVPEGNEALWLSMFWSCARRKWSQVVTTQIAKPEGVASLAKELAKIKTPHFGSTPRNEEEKLLLGDRIWAGSVCAAQRAVALKEIVDGARMSAIVPGVFMNREEYTAYQLLSMIDEEDELEMRISMAARKLSSASVLVDHSSIMVG